MLPIKNIFKYSHEKQLPLKPPLSARLRELKRSLKPPLKPPLKDGEK